MELAKQKFEQNRLVFETLKDIVIRLPNLERIDVGMTKPLKWRHPPRDNERSIETVLVAALETLDAPVLVSYWQKNELAVLDIVLVREWGHFYEVSYIPLAEWMPEHPCEPTSLPNWYVCQFLNYGDKSDS